MIHCEQLLITHRGRLIYHKVGRGGILSHIIMLHTANYPMKGYLGTETDVHLLGVF